MARRNLSVWPRFVRIFMSTLTSEIGLKLAQDEWSRLGFGIITILAVKRLGVKAWPSFTALNIAVKWGAKMSDNFL